MAGDGNYGGNGSVYTQTILGDGQTAEIHDEEVDTTGRSFSVDLNFCISPVGVEEAAPTGAMTGDVLVQAKRQRAAQIQEILDDVIRQANDHRAALDAAVRNPDTVALPAVVRVRVPVPMVTRRGKPTGTPADPWEVKVHWD